MLQRLCTVMTSQFYQQNVQVRNERAKKKAKAFRSPAPVGRAWNDAVSEGQSDEWRIVCSERGQVNLISGVRPNKGWVLWHCAWEGRRVREFLKFPRSLGLNNGGCDECHIEVRRMDRKHKLLHTAREAWRDWTPVPSEKDSRYAYTFSQKIWNARSR